MNRIDIPRLPLVELPFPSKRNPGARLVADQVVAWAERAGLLADHAVRARLAHDAWLDFAVWTYPAAPAERLAAIAALDVLMFLDDDRADEAADGSGSLIGELLAGHTDLTDLLSTLDRGMSPGWSARLRADLAAWTTANREAVARHATGPPPLADYIGWRRLSVTAWWHFDLVEYAAGRELPPGFRESARHQLVTEAAADIIAWTNDLFSAPGELARGDPNNLLAVLVAHHHLTPQEAAEECVARLAERTRSFVAQRAALPPELAWFGDALAAWCRGNLDYCRTSNRYRPNAMKGA